MWVGLTAAEAQNFQRSFELMDDLTVTFDVRSIEPTGDGLDVTVNTTYDFTAGGHRDNTTFPWVLELAERGGRWVVVASRS